MNKIVEITTLYVVSLFELSNSDNKQKAIADFNYAKLTLDEALNTYNLICDHFKLKKYDKLSDDFAFDFFDAVVSIKK